jgi:predicted DNA-binding protein (UPF0251 family)|tara:strand:- start:138 stop:371 length:234 start_codon:yes stop_codon:yes gene_type:complete
MGRKAKWELEIDKQDALRTKAIKNLTEDQLKAVQKTYRTLENVLVNIREVEDIYLSDIKEMDTCLWKLNNEFNLGVK